MVGRLRDLAARSGRLVELASALRRRLVVSVVPTAMGGSRIYDATLAGKRVGSITVHDRFAHDLFGNITGKKTPKISRSSVEEPFRGMGIGKKLYSEVIKREGRVMSDSSVSGEARRVYESLKKNKNIKIRTLPAVETPGELVGRNGAYQQRPPGLTNGFGGRPVFASLWKSRELAAHGGRLVEFGLLGHPLKYNRPYIQGDLSIPRGGGNYQAPEAFRFNNQGEKFAPGQDAALAQARKNGVITVGLKKTAKGGWKSVAEASGLKRAADVKRSVIRHEIVHSIQRAKAASKGESFARNMLNPVKKYIAEVGAYATQNRRRSGIGLGEKLFPTFKAMLNARRSM